MEGKSLTRCCPALYQLFVGLRLGIDGANYAISLDGDTCYIRNALGYAIALIIASFAQSLGVERYG